MAAIIGVSFLVYLPGLACLAMLFMCVRMLLGGHHEPDRKEDEIAELRAEVAQLRQERDTPRPEDSIRD